MRWLILGAGGFFAGHLKDALAGEDVTALPHTHCDVTCSLEVGPAVARADVVLNAAAWSDVDGAERDPVACHRVNIGGAAAIARAAARAGALMVHLSTDYVFDGAHAPYAPDAPPNPLSVYGQSKRASELAAAQGGARLLVVRLQALYGAGGRHFASRLPDLLRRNIADLEIDDERIVQPTWAPLAAQHVVALARAGATGTFHVSAAGGTTWAGFARALCADLGLPARFTPVPTAALATAARRPPDTRFDHAHLAAAGLPPLGDWRDGLAAFAATLGALPTDAP